MAQKISQGNKLSGVNGLGSVDFNTILLFNRFVVNHEGKVDQENVEAMPRLILPGGKTTMGPGSWTKLGTWRNLIAARDEVAPTVSGPTMGSNTMQRLRITLDQLKLYYTDPNDLTGLRKHMWAEVRRYIDLPFHEWLFPVGPLLGWKKSGPHVLQYGATWAEVLGMVACEGYLRVFIDSYNLLIELHNLGCSLMVSTDLNLMLLRWLHVICSIGIHIDVIEELDMRIGGNWHSVLQELRDTRNVMSAEFGVNMGYINRLTEQLSMKVIKDPNANLGAVCGGGIGKFQAGTLKDGWCR